MFLLALRKILFGRSGIQNSIAVANMRRKRMAKFRCEVTGCSHKDCKLEVHHLLDVNRFPMFAASVWNLRVVRADIHDGYHSWMGGTHKGADPISWYFFLLLLKLGMVKLYAKKS
ncbi:MAG: hypothetical protein ACK4RS_00165 [Thiothrix sp.]